MKEKILLVDDDQEILDTFSRLLRKQFKIDTALEAKEGLIAVSKGGPYAVIVSDMRMPGMDGIQFLTRVKEVAPNTVRIMLTGNADMNTAVQAVNEGSIFRFLNKPCSPEAFTNALSAGVEQYRLITAERELLEKTLSRSIKVLIDILSAVNPIAFSRAARIRRYVKHIASELGLPNAWQFELAAMLSQIGCVTIPLETLEKVQAGVELKEDEQEMLNAHPSIGRDLLEKIPRLEPIALMIENQKKNFSDYKSLNVPAKRGEVEVGAQMLKVAIECDRLLSEAGQFQIALEELLKRPESCDPAIVSTLKNMTYKKSDKVARNLKIDSLSAGMLAGENVYTKNRLLLVSKGQEITYPLLQRLRNFSRKGLVKDQIRILSERNWKVPILK